MNIALVAAIYELFCPAFAHLPTSEVLLRDGVAFLEQVACVVTMGFPESFVSVLRV
jgi:hypothetical protein